MTSYRQLSQDLRYQFHAFLKASFPQPRIAAELEVDRSTIWRELNRNRGQRGYRPKQAQHPANSRREAKDDATRITPATRQQVDALLTRDWSPEQISGTLKRQGRPCASHERIYHHIYADKQQGGDLRNHLRPQKKRRKRYGKYDRRGQSPSRKSIDERPAIVASKGRPGDWEADTIIGKNHHQAMVSLVERQSELTRLAKVERNTEAAVKQAVINMLKPLAESVHTITSDNGREFAAHETIAEALGADSYLAHPYQSWERGLKENTNGIVRQYFPEGSDFTQITDQQVQAVAERLNERPGKTVGYQRPNHVFFNSSPVALRC